MIRTAITAAILLASTASVTRSQQAAMPRPPKTVHPTPLPTSCRGCSDGTTDTPMGVQRYDDKTADTTRKTAPRKVTPVAHKVKPAARPAKHHRAKPKHKSKITAAKPDTAKK